MALTRRSRSPSGLPAPEPLGALVSARARDRFPSPAALEQLAIDRGLSPEQYTALCREYCERAIVEHERLTTLACHLYDPIILHYYHHVHEELPTDLPTATQEAITAAVKRTKRRQAAIDTLRSHLGRLEWDLTEENQYVHDVLAAATATRSRAFSTLAATIRPSTPEQATFTTQAFVTRELTRLILFRVTFQPRRAAFDTTLETADLSALGTAIAQLQGKAVQDADARRLAQMTTAGGGHPSSPSTPPRRHLIPGPDVTQADLVAAVDSLRRLGVGPGRRLALDRMQALVELAPGQPDPAHPRLPPLAPHPCSPATHGPGEAASAAVDPSALFPTPTPTARPSRILHRPAAAGSPSPPPSPPPTQHRAAAAAATRRPSAPPPAKRLCSDPIGVPMHSSAPAPSTAILGSGRRCYCDRLPRPLPARLRAELVALPSCVDGVGALEARAAASAFARSADRYGICHNHAWTFGSTVGLYKNRRDATALRECIRLYGSIDLTTWFASEEASLFLKPAFRPVHRVDAGSLAAVPLPPVSAPDGLDTFFLPPAHAHRLLAEVFPGMEDSWRRDGDVVSDIFGHLLRHPTLEPLLRDEWDMYAFHYRAKGGQGNKGWLRNMLFSVSQQLVRTHPLFYLLHVLLHPDHPLRLISYPYETKYARATMPTAFLHVDLNVGQAADALAPGSTAVYPLTSLVQSAVSFDDEEASSCTKIVTGLHDPTTFCAWAATQPRTSAKVQAAVSLSLEQQQRWKLGFRTDVALAGEVRISHPCNIHGSTGPARQARRVVFAWLVPHDGVTLTQPGTGTVAQVSHAHRSQHLDGTLSSPSGYANVAGVPTERFATAVQLQLRSPLANALVGRRAFDDPAVRAELTVLFGRDPSARVALLTQHAEDLVASAAAALQQTLDLERVLYGPSSFAANQATFLESDHHFRSTTPDAHARVEYAQYLRQVAKLPSAHPAAPRRRRLSASADSSPLSSPPPDSELDGGAHPHPDPSDRPHESSDDEAPSAGEEAPAHVAPGQLTTLAEHDKRHPAREYRGASHATPSTDPDHAPGHDSDATDLGSVDWARWTRADT